MDSIEYATVRGKLIEASWNARKIDIWIAWNVGWPLGGNKKYMWFTTRLWDPSVGWEICTFAPALDWRGSNDSKCWVARAHDAIIPKKTFIIDYHQTSAISLIGYTLLLALCPIDTRHYSYPVNSPSFVGFCQFWSNTWWFAIAKSLRSLGAWSNNCCQNTFMLPHRKHSNSR